MAVPESSVDEGDPLYVAKCALQSAIVLQAVCGHIRTPSSFDVVFGKETSLELVVVGEDGNVQSVCKQPVFGTIKDLRVLPWNENFRSSHPQFSGKDLLVLLSDSGKMSFITFSLDLNRFLAVTHTHLAPTGNSGNDLSSTLAIEPRGRAVAVSAFYDRIAVFPASAAAGNNVVEKGMVYPGESRSAALGVVATGSRESRGGLGTIWSMAFVECTENFAGDKEGVLILVLLVHRSTTPAAEILVLKCDIAERRFYELATLDPAIVSPSTNLALNLIEFPALPGYLLLSRSGDLLLLDLRIPDTPRASTISSGQQQSFPDKSRTVDEGEGSDTLAASALLELQSRGGDSPEKSSVCAWSWQPDCGDQPKLVLGMDTGDVAIAQVTIANREVFNIEIRELIYRCSPCKSLLWANGGFIAALVEMGDGQILEVMEGGLSFRTFIQNLSPIIDFTLVDYHEVKQDQMFASCGVGQEGSIRVIRTGTSVERLHSTGPEYQGVTGTWTLRMLYSEEHHSFFVMSFVEETRVLSVGLKFVDISESVGFDCSSSTLTCGLIEDGWVAQVCSKGVLLCAPTIGAHPAGSLRSSPSCVSWKPQDACISLGAVSKGKIVVALSRPGVLMVLGIKMTDNGIDQVVEIQKCQLGSEVSCISIPSDEESISSLGPSHTNILSEENRSLANLYGLEFGKVCVVGTRKPSVELLSIGQEDGIKPLAVGLLSLANSFGTLMGGCVPESVRLALFDRLYVLCGLRNGMLLRYEWPPTNTSTLPSRIFLRSTDTSFSYESGSSSKPVDTEKRKSVFAEESERAKTKSGEVPRAVHLRLVDVRRIGISPASLIPLQPSLRANIIVLSDRPWLLQTSRNSQRIAYRSISFQPSTHVTPVSSPECPNGVLFVADCCLHLVQMEQSTSLNVKRMPLSRSPRHVLYHAETKMLVVMRGDPFMCDICFVDPVSGAFKTCFQLDEGEVGICMTFWRQNEEELLVVGTGPSEARAIMPNGEQERTRGRLLVFRIQQALSGMKKTVYSGFSSGAPAAETLTMGENQSHLSGPMEIGDSAVVEDVSQYPHGSTGVVDWELGLVTQKPGVTFAATPYLEHYLLVSSGNTRHKAELFSPDGRRKPLELFFEPGGAIGLACDVSMAAFRFTRCAKGRLRTYNLLFCLKFPTEGWHRLKRLATVRTRFVITRITVHLHRIAVADCRDGVLFYSFQEASRKFEQVKCDPIQRLVADCVLTDLDTAIVTDRQGNFCVLKDKQVESVSPERNLTISCWYHMGETIMRIQKGSFAYRPSADENSKLYNAGNVSRDVRDGSLVASTLLGSVFVFIQVTREEYNLLRTLQKRLATHSLTAPLSGNNHSQYRSKGCPEGALQVLDGDMLGQFLELTNSQQQMVLAGDDVDVDSYFHPEDPIQLGLLKALGKDLPLEQVLGLFDRIHNFLT